MSPLASIYPFRNKKTLLIIFTYRLYNFVAYSEAQHSSNIKKRKEKDENAVNMAVHTALKMEVNILVAECLFLQIIPTLCAEK